MTPLAATAVLTRSALRRDRVRLPVWLAAIAGFAAAVTSSVVGLYVTEVERQAQAAFAAGNVVTRAFNGPASGADLGSLVLVEGFAICAVLVGLLAVHTVVRHTRAEEEAGRAELVGSAVVGRLAPLAAALLVAGGGVAVAGAVVAGVLALHGLPLGGAVLAGVALASVGVVLAAVAAVAVQLAPTARAASGGGVVVLAAAFLLRALGDAAGTVVGGTELRSAWPAWLSPIGWGQQVRPFADAHLEVLLVPSAATLVLLAAAVALRGRRDLGAGLVPPRPGPADAGPMLERAAGLAWRLQRGAVAAWLIGLTVVGASFGAVGLDVEDVVGDNPQLREVLVAGGGFDALFDAYVAFSAGFLAALVAAVPVQVLLRARAEEQAGRLEPLLATATSRSRWLTGHVTIAVVAAAGANLAVGGGAASAFAVLGGAGDDAVAFLAGTLVHLPATLALAGVTVAALALAPRIASPLAWTLVAANAVLGSLGAMLDLPDAVRSWAPSSHVPAVPLEPLAATPLVVLVVVAVGATGVGYLAFARRDPVAAA